MKSFKSVRKVILAATLILVVMLAASAAEEPVMEMAQVQLIQDGYIPTAPTEAIAVIDDEFAPLQSVDTVSDGRDEIAASIIYAGLEDPDSIPDYTKYGLPIGTILFDESVFDSTKPDNSMSKAEFLKLYQELVDSNADLFYVASGLQVFFDSSGAIVAVLPTYKIWNSSTKEFQGASYWSKLTPNEKQAIKTAQKTYDKLIDEILDEVEDDWSTLEKLLYLHDYLAAHFEYDMRVYDPEHYQETIYDSYTFLTKGTGVCQAYYLTYRALLNELEITTDYASSENANHIWNLVYINENWYHIDVTWDDPTPDRLGQVCHDWFLTSTTQMLKQDGEKSDWVSGAGATANATTYDNAYWRDVNTAFVEEDNVWYYFKVENVEYPVVPSTICATSDVDTAGAAVLNLSVPVWGANGSYWLGAFTGLAECEDWIIYNTPEQIVAWNTETNDTKILLTHNSDDTDIYGFSLFDDDIKYVISDSSNGPFSECETIEDVDKLLGKPKPVFQEKYTKAVKNGKTSIKLSEDNKVYIERGDDNAHYFMAAVYGANHRMKSFKMISSAEIESKGYTEWALTLADGDTVKLFLLNGQMVPEA